MHKRQTGVTFIGWLVLLVPVAIVLYIGIRLTPIYLTHFKVVKVVQQAANEAKADSVVNPSAVRNGLERRLDIEGVAFPTLDEIKVVREGENWAIDMNYERVEPLFGDINLLVTFDKRVVIE